MRVLKLSLACAVLAATVSVNGEDSHHGHSHDGHDHHGHSHSEEVVEVEKVERHPQIPADLLKRIDFLETFQDGPKALEKGWVKSKNDRYFSSEWIIASAFSEKDEKPHIAFEDEQSLAVNVKHRHYGLSHVLAEPFDNTGKTMVFQYEVRYHEGVGCSGAYAKLLLHQKEFDATALEEASPYVVMFGPDRCGSTNKVHFIVRQKLPNNKWEEKHMTKVIPAKISDNYSHLYTLVIRPDNTFSILIDQVEETSGSLLSSTDFTPPFGAPKEIDDPSDSKPADWVDIKEIPDPSASKPVDWDEDAPQTIPDPDAKKPEGWDDEEDGEWQAPPIPNPEYKGKWKAPIIPNPAYKGEWKPKRIPNPDFFVEEHPSNLEPIGTVSFEILANDRGIAFDNILLTHDEKAAAELANLVFKPKQALEKAAEERIRKQKSKADRLKALEQGGPMAIIMYYYSEFTDFVASNLIPFIVSILVVILSVFYFCCWGASTAAQDNKNPEAKDDDDDDDEDDDAVPPSSSTKDEKVKASEGEETKNNAE